MEIKNLIETISTNLNDGNGKEGVVKALTMIRRDTMEEGDTTMTNFSKELCRRAKIEYPGDEHGRSKLESQCYQILSKFGVPHRGKKFHEFVASQLAEERGTAEVTWEETYDDYIMPECTGHVLDLLEQGQNVLLTGPKGCGKTSLAEILFEKVMEKNYTTIDISPEVSRMDLEGCPELSTKQVCSECGSEDLKFNGNTECGNCGTKNSVRTFDVSTWRDGLLAAACRAGNSIVFNELDALSEALTTGFMELFQSRRYTLMQTGERLTAEGIQIIATSNTIGSGSDEMYSRNFLDKAFLSRCVPIYVDYLSKEDETKIILHHNQALSHPYAQKAVNLAQWTREAHMQGSLTDVISTRELVQFAKMYEMNPRWDLAATVKVTLCNRFNGTEIVQVMEAAGKFFGLKDEIKALSF